MLPCQAQTLAPDLLHLGVCTHIWQPEPLPADKKGVVRVQEKENRSKERNK